MRKWTLSGAALLALLPLQASAHRLDEYLEATLLSVQSGWIAGSMRLVPGVAVSQDIIGRIDRNHDGVFSEEEQQAYAQQVMRDLVLKIDGRLLPIHLVSETFPAPDGIRQGLGEIELQFAADLPAGRTARSLIFENHHRPDVAVYLVNSLVPLDANLHLGQQVRNRDQSTYTLDFTSGSAALPDQTGRTLNVFGSVFRLGARHIAEGTDHLLFLLTLLLVAPLLASSGRWSRPAPIKRSMVHITGIVTAFTIGHSCTLLLSALGWLHLPASSVETLIAISIMVSAAHAMRPIFPGREAAVAGCFGLVHGLAFASAIAELGFAGWYRVLTVVAFNCGIEAMQLVVIAATLPSLLLLSRTPVYRYVRLAGALFAIAASLGWIMERAFHLTNALEPLVKAVAGHGPWLALALLLLSVVSWAFRKGVRGSFSTEQQEEHNAEVVSRRVSSLT